MLTGHEFADGGEFILKTFEKEKIKASFFFTGDFYRNTSFKELIRKVKKKGHYLGAHSDKHLLYCSWEKRDSLLVSREDFKKDLQNNYLELSRLGIEQEEARFFLPPYEWYNDTISQWTKEFGLQLINFTPGTRTTADYTWPTLPNYRTSDEIYKSIIDIEKNSRSGLNGFILLVHIGTDPRRTDKFYHKLPQLFTYLKLKGYSFKRIDELLEGGNR